MQTVQSCGKPQGGGGSKTPTANHWHPLPFWEAPLWPNVGPLLGQAIGLCISPAALEARRGTLGGGSGEVGGGGGGGHLGASWALGALLGRKWYGVQPTGINSSHSRTDCNRFDTNSNYSREDARHRSDVCIFLVVVVVVVIVVVIVVGGGNTHENEKCTGNGRPSDGEKGFLLRASEELLWTF